MDKLLMSLGEESLWDGFVAQGFANKDIPAKIEEHYLKQALKSDPLGGTCGFCGGKNTNVDDCGFWYLVPLSFKTYKSKGKSLPACETCHRGEPGKHHIEIFGVGER